MYGILDEYYGIDTTPKKNIEEIILDRLGNSENYHAFWKEGVLKTLSKELGYNAHGITFGFIPNYGGQVEFSMDLGGGQRTITQIQFYVSLLDNVHTIQILEIEESIEHHPFLKKDLPKQILKEVWVSPEEHRNKDIFLRIQNSLEMTFGNSLYLPYSIQQIKLGKIRLPHTDDKHENTIGDAFFRKILPLHQTDSIIRGNPNYGFDKLV
ncbi:hypothetical protein [Flagellimonas baculiformis]|uniref:hypothetical protein n=1 Tax=Flagellimonas baculiformis TaxID=3067310 RepID=UPI00296FC924|nr:hypothetical protein [Muricauda sp. D6]